MLAVNKTVTDSTDSKQLNDKPWQFKPGQSGNPSGRVKGSRNKLGEDFLKTLHEDFKSHGKEAIEKCRTEEPLGYVRVCASLLPAEVKVTQTTVFDEFTASELSSLADAIERGLARTSEQVAPRGSDEEAGELPAVH